jgi:hypothetical protein
VTMDQHLLKLVDHTIVHSLTYLRHTLEAADVDEETKRLVRKVVEQTTMQVNELRRIAGLDEEHA